MKKKKGLDEVTIHYGIGLYFLGVSVVFFSNIIANLPWYLNLFCFICFFPTSMIFISRAKKMNRELQKKIKKEKKKNDKKTRRK